LTKPGTVSRFGAVQPDAARTAYAGKLLSVTVEHWGSYDREIVEHPGAVAIVAIDGDGQVALVRQLREPARKELLELPAGTVEPGEAPLETAKRELEEETGLRGGEWREAAAFWTTPGFCRELMTLFLAVGVEQGGQRALDADERVELVRYPTLAIPALISEIEDAKTLVGLLLYLRFSAA
jgi:ADP-ribose pyrophosphatase